LDLKRKVENFQERFNTYLDEQGARLTEETEKLREAIEMLKKELMGYVFQ